jgi:peptidoglycan/xylan/chitin deacetylase (PgdA/CDA1 family)
VLWTVAVERFADHEGPAAAARDVLARIRPGAIVLAHDGGPPDRARTLARLPLVLDGLRRRGYLVVTVSELLALARAPAASVGARPA